MTTEARTDYRIDWNALTLPQLFDELARADAVIAVERALAEDLGAAGISGDVTSAVTIAPLLAVARVW